MCCVLVEQLMVVALVQKCARDAIDRGLPAPNNLGFLLDEFFDFYGIKLNYSAVGKEVWCIFAHYRCHA